MTTITGGVTAPKGFRASGLHCGVKDNFTTPQPDKKDLAMVLSDVPCTAAGTYTRNVVKADPVLLTMKHLADGKARLKNMGTGEEREVILPDGLLSALYDSEIEGALNDLNATLESDWLRKEEK